MEPVTKQTCTQAGCILFDRSLCCMLGMLSEMWLLLRGGGEAVSEMWLLLFQEREERDDDILYSVRSQANNNVMHVRQHVLPET